MALTLTASPCFTHAQLLNRDPVLMTGVLSLSCRQ